MSKKILVNAMYDFCFDNIKMDDVESDDNGLLTFESKEKLDSFLSSNNFVLYDLMEYVLITTNHENKEDRNIYGKVESGL